MNKNDSIVISITDMSNEGLGIGHFEGMAVFVKDTVIGDVVRAKIVSLKKNLAFGKAEEILEKSPSRTQAPCPVSRPCGGCQLQMMDYAAQLEFKTQRVKNALRRIGGFDETWLEETVSPCIGMEYPFRYRNKAQFPVGRSKEGELKAGFYAGRTHDIISCEDCLIGMEENRPIVRTVLAHMKRFRIEPYDEKSGTGLVRHIYIRKGFATGQIMTVLVINGSTLPGEKELAAALEKIPGMTSVALNVNTDNTNVILGKRMRNLYGPEEIEDLIGKVRFRISPRSFYQVNPVQTEKLYEKVLEFAALTGKEQVWDLYCGIGTISLFLAEHAGRVIGVEIVPEAVRDAKRNAALNGLNNTEFYTGSAEDVTKKLWAEQYPGADVVVVDPPRKGCDRRLLETIIDMAPRRVVYVSCDPATLGRDLRYLSDNGFAVRKVQPFDMFCQTVHVENVCLLENTGKGGKQE